jgi:hypothetical protein
MRSGRVLFCACLYILGTGCYTEPALIYPCHSDANCVQLGAQGLCLSAGSASYCAFPDTRCPGGYRWDVTAPPVISDNCVRPPGTPQDGGAGD